MPVLRTDAAGPESPNGPLSGPWPVQVEIYFLAAVLLGSAIPMLHRWWGLAGIALGHLAIFGLLPLLWARLTSPQPVPHTLRLRPVAAAVLGRALLMGVLGWVVGQGLSVLVLALVGKMVGPPPEPYNVFFSSGAPFWLLLLILAALPAVTEEIAFRGLVLSGYRHLGPRAAWIGTAVLFAVLHGSLWRLPSLLVLGLLYSFVVWHTGSVWPGVLMHFLNNAIALTVVYWIGTPSQADSTVVVPSAAVAFWALSAGLALPGLVALARSLVKVQSNPHQIPEVRRVSGMDRWLPLGLALTWIALSMYQEWTLTLGNR